MLRITEVFTPPSLSPLHVTEYKLRQKAGLADVLRTDLLKNTSAEETHLHFQNKYV